jgi:hypothetical protein
MENIEKNISKVLRKSSATRAWSILLLCVCLIAVAVLLRFFVLSVWNFEGKKYFVCELALCRENSEKGDLLLANLRRGNAVLLWQAGKSSETIEIPTPFDTLSLSIPSTGDTIVFDSLNPMLWDLAATLYRELFPEKKTAIDVSLWNMEKEMPFSSVGRASISGRPVSEREVVFLPWQELRLLELQLQKIFPALDSIHFKRKLLEDTLEIKSFIIDEDLFYLSCEKPEQQRQCYDSRENGFFRKSMLKGIAIFTSWV